MSCWLENDLYLNPEFFKYFEGKISYTDAIDKVKQNTRNYAKRQITWLKKYNKSIKVYFNQDVNKIINELYKSLKWKN